MTWNLARLVFRRDARKPADPAGRFLDQAEITDGYEWLLGRTPSNEEIEAARNYFSGHDDNSQAFQNGVIASEEFRNRRIGVQQHMRSVPVDLFGRKTIFLHIEKCAGTTLRTMLESQFQPSRVCSERFNGLADWTANELAAYELFAGHFDLTACSVVPGRQTAVITMLREPRARLLSLFNFWKAHRPDPAFSKQTLVGLAQGCTAAEFFSHPSVVRHPSIRDAMAAQLTRDMGSSTVIDGFPKLSDTDPVLAAPDECLQTALRNLDGLACFGLVEKFELSIELFNRQLGLRMPAVEPRQVLGTLVSTGLDPGRGTPARIDETLRALLDHLTPIDRQLYARAAARFSERAASFA